MGNVAAENHAYDLTRYEEKTEQKPKMQVIKRAQPIKSLYGVRPITLVMTAMAVVIITAMLLYNNAMIAEISADVTAASNQLEQLQNENSRLNRELDAKISNDSISQYAVNELGLGKLEKYQVEYINLTAEDVVVAKESSGFNLFAMIGQVITKIQEYLKF